MNSDSWTIRLLLAAGLWALQPAVAQSSERSAKLDINQATAEDFTRLAGVGPARAAAIVRIREHSGPFRSVEELRALPRLPEKVFQQLRDQVTVIVPPASATPRNRPTLRKPIGKTSEKQQGTIPNAPSVNLRTRYETNRRDKSVCDTMRTV